MSNHFYERGIRENENKKEAQGRYARKYSCSYACSAAGGIGGTGAGGCATACRQREHCRLRRA